MQVTELFNPLGNFKIMIWQETGKNKYNCLQIYIPPHRKSIAIEPVTSNIDAFNTGEGLTLLQPGEIFEAKYGIRFN